MFYLRLKKFAALITLVIAFADGVSSVLFKMITAYESYCPICDKLDIRDDMGQLYYNYYFVEEFIRQFF